MDDFITGKVKVFKGDLYTGGFEQNGKVLMKSVLVKVLVIKMARQIPAEGHDEKFVFSDGLDVYELNVISPKKNQQLIKNKSKGKVLWCVQGPEFYKPCL